MREAAAPSVVAETFLRVFIALRSRKLPLWNKLPLLDRNCLGKRCCLLQIFAYPSALSRKKYRGYCFLECHVLAFLKISHLLVTLGIGPRAPQDLMVETSPWYGDEKSHFHKGFCAWWGLSVVCVLCPVFHVWKMKHNFLTQTLLLPLILPAEAVSVFRIWKGRFHPLGLCLTVLTCACLLPSSYWGWNLSGNTCNVCFGWNQLLKSLQAESTVLCILLVTSVSYCLPLEVSEEILWSSKSNLRHGSLWSKSCWNPYLKEK